MHPPEVVTVPKFVHRICFKAKLRATKDYTLQCGYSPIANVNSSFRSRWIKKGGYLPNLSLLPSLNQSLNSLLPYVLAV